LDVCGTFAESINDAGVTVGFFCTENGPIEGFLRAANGNITTGDVFDSGYTEAYSINAKNAITGFYEDSNSVMHGFLLIP
ncbi:MAG: hypothetical protein WBX03_06140, partial [Terriglobales bacterium]